MLGERLNEMRERRKLCANGAMAQVNLNACWQAATAQGARLPAVAVATIWWSIHGASFHRPLDLKADQRAAGARACWHFNQGGADPIGRASCRYSGYQTC